MLLLNDFYWLWPVSSDEPEGTHELTEQGESFATDSGEHGTGRRECEAPTTRSRSVHPEVGELGDAFARGVRAGEHRGVLRTRGRPEVHAPDLGPVAVGLVLRVV